MQDTSTVTVFVKCVLAVTEMFFVFVDVCRLNILTVWSKKKGHTAEHSVLPLSGEVTDISAIERSNFIFIILKAVGCSTCITKIQALKIRCHLDTQTEVVTQC